MLETAGRVASPPATRPEDAVCFPAVMHSERTSSGKPIVDIWELCPQLGPETQPLDRGSGSKVPLK